MRADFHDVMEFALLTGIRLKGCVTLTWRNIDFEQRTIRYIKKRERGQPEAWGSLPMTSAVEAILRRQFGHDRTYVWTFVAQGKQGRSRCSATPRSPPPANTPTSSTPICAPAWNGRRPSTPTAERPHPPPPLRIAPSPTETPTEPAT